MKSSQFYFTCARPHPTVNMDTAPCSVLEWHPFSISSAADDDVTTHHIKGLGPKSFTRRLQALAAKAKAEGRLDKLTLNIDGPYGEGSSRPHAEL